MHSVFVSLLLSFLFALFYSVCFVFIKTVHWCAGHTRNDRAMQQLGMLNTHMRSPCDTVVFSNVSLFICLYVCLPQPTIFRNVQKYLNAVCLIFFCRRHGRRRRLRRRRRCLCRWRHWRCRLCCQCQSSWQLAIILEIVSPTKCLFYKLSKSELLLCQLLLSFLGLKCHNCSITSCSPNCSITSSPTVALQVPPQ